ncbi:hypothetical protein BVI2075_1260024 [Burkholderia vietnamiensis]|nr:hypothetical protein BVI2075_1260024 [Burkholderia vietnamiensis]
MSHRHRAVCVLESDGSVPTDFRTTHHGQEIRAAPGASGADLLGVRQLLPDGCDALRQRLQSHAASMRIARRRLVSLRRLGHRIQRRRSRRRARRTGRRAVIATSCPTRVLF